MTVVAEGADYSATASDDWSGLAAALKAAGKRFVLRYAVYDKAPNGRGITAAEYRALTAAGLDVALYYEEDAGWMRQGFSAGVRAATRALDVIRGEGMPAGMPVMYSDDNPPETDDFSAVVQCLGGAASIVGLERTGFYGGWDAIDYVMGAGAARFYVQTLAWQYGRGLHPGIHLHQYGFNQYFAGTNCDLVAALQPHFGQASDYLAVPATTTTTTTPSPYAMPRTPPAWTGKDADAYGEHWLAIRRPVRATGDAPRLQLFDTHGPVVGPPIPKGTRFEAWWYVRTAKGNFVVTENGTVVGTGNIAPKVLVKDGR